MPNTLDTLAAKADALEVMRNRNDPNYRWALKVFEEERREWAEELRSSVMKQFGLTRGEYQ